MPLQTDETMLAPIIARAARLHMVGDEMGSDEDAARTTPPFRSAVKQKASERLKNFKHMVGKARPPLRDAAGDALAWEDVLTDATGETPPGAPLAGETTPPAAANPEPTLDSMEVTATPSASPSPAPASVGEPAKAAAPGTFTRDAVSQMRSACDLIAAGLRGFGGPLNTSLLQNRLRDNQRREAVVTRPFAYGCLVAERFLAVVVPRGFVTDFASIPGIFTAILRPMGMYAEAAVIHDWLYAIGKNGDGKAREQADRAFSMAMRESGVNFLVRWILYSSVRVFGFRDYGGPKEWRFVDPDSVGGEGSFEPPFTQEEARSTLYCQQSSQ